MEIIRRNRNQNGVILIGFTPIPLIYVYRLFLRLPLLKVNIVNIVNSNLNQSDQLNRDIGLPKRFGYTIQILINNINNRSQRGCTYDIRIKFVCFTSGCVQYWNHDKIFDINMILINEHCIY